MRSRWPKWPWFNSQQSAAFHSRTVEDHALGFYEALLEARIPFDMVHDRLLDWEKIAHYRVLILPNIAALSDRQCGQITDYVRRGGSIVATYETSLYDEWGVRRPDFGLAEMFGASFAGANPLTLVPPYPNLPMEEVYARVPHTDTPGVFLRTAGKGRVVYFPFDIDRTFWEVLAADLGLVMRNAVAWAHGGTQPLTVTGKGMLDVALWAQKGSITAHLVNLTNPMMLKGPLLNHSFPSTARADCASARGGCETCAVAGKRHAGAAPLGRRSG